MDSHTTDSSHSKPSRLGFAIIIACAFFLIFKYLMNVSVSIMTPELMREFHIKGVGLGMLGSTFLVAYLVVQLFSGLLLDSFSVRVVASVAILISIAGLYLFGWSTNFTEALIGRGLQGVGAAFATVTYMKLTANWFHPRYFSRIVGYVATAAMVGAVAGDAPLAIINQHFGWRAAISVCMGVGIVLFVFFAFIVRNRPKYPPCREMKENSAKRLHFADVKAILSSPTNWMVLLYTGLAFSPVAVFASLWGNPFLHSVYHIPSADVPLYSTVMFIGLGVGGPLLGLISDKTGKRLHVMFYSALGSLIMMILAIYVDTQPLWCLAVDLFLAGLLCGGFMLGFSIAKEWNPLFVAGTVIAFANTGDPVVGAWTDPLIGWILDRHWDHTLLNGAPIFSPHAYHLSMIVLIANLVLACVFVGLIGKMIKRQKAKEASPSAPN